MRWPVAATVAQDARLAITASMDTLALARSVT
jgi:hypothetical protein